MAAFGKLELRAISWYSKEHGLVPQLSLYPEVTFTRNGVVELHNVHNVLGEFDRNRKQIAKTEAKLRRNLKKARPVVISLF